MTDHADQSFTIDGRRIHCEIRGDGPPILFVHGFPLSGRLWRAVVAGLEDDYRCIVPDLRGHGASEPTPSATMAGYADDLAQLLDALGVGGPVTVVGMSMGGYVAFEFCRRHPDRVRALVLANTRAQADTADAAANRRDTARRVLEEGSGIVADAMLPKLFGPGASEELKTEWRRIMSETPPAGVAAAQHAMASRPDSFGTLADLERPVLIIAGGEDVITPPSDAEQMNQAASDSRLEVIRDAGHMAAVEKPAELVGILRSFLAEVEES
jgi:pimeloyl-ACP methyl ester carboxylesterase